MMLEIRNLNLSDEEISERLMSMKTCSTDEDSMFFNYLRVYRGGVLAIDIDGVLCEDVGEYPQRMPLLFPSEHPNFRWIILYTARLERDRKTTEEWLSRYGIQYDALLMNKLPYDLLIDDKSQTKF